MTADLITRLESADGPSRELDAAIATLLGICLHPNTIYTGAQSDTGFSCADCGADSWGNRSKDGHNRRLHDQVPTYTASIDAALTLVPEGWTYEGRQGPSGFPHMWTLSTIKCGDVRYTTATGRARFAALALAAAALKARGV